MNHKDNNFASSLTRDNIKTMKTAYENLLKNLELIDQCQGKYYGESITFVLGIDEEGVDFLIKCGLLRRVLTDIDGSSNMYWYLGDLLLKLSSYKHIYDKEVGRFELRLKLYKIFGKRNFEKAFDWVFGSDVSEWENKMKCINYNCGVTGGALTSGDTLGEAIKMYELLNK